MVLNHKIEDKAILIYLNGRLDIHFSEKIEKSIIELISSNPDKNIVIDLKDVSYVSSSGLRLLVAIKKKLSDMMKKLHISNANPHIKTVFTVAGLEKDFSIFDSEAEALKELT